MEGIELRRAEDQEGYYSWCGELRRFWDEPGNAVWNAWQGETLVGSLELTLFRSSELLLSTELNDFRGPYFHQADPDSPALLLQGVYVCHELRGHGLGSELVALAGSLGYPLYAEFANPNLRDHCERHHLPDPDATSRERDLARAAARAAAEQPLDAPETFSLHLRFRDGWFTRNLDRRGLPAAERDALAAACYLGPLFADPALLGLASVKTTVVEDAPGELTLTLNAWVERPGLLEAQAALCGYRAALAEQPGPDDPEDALRLLCV